MIAMEYARDPSRVLDLKSWVWLWPPVPFIINGFVLRLVLFPGMSDASTGVMAVQLTSVFFVFLGIFFIGRSIALQIDEPTGLLACLMVFCAPILLILAHTPMSEVYAFFFISLAIWNMFRFVAHKKGLMWLILSFVLAYFCRTESLFFAFVAGGFLLIHHRWRSAVFLMGIMIVLVVSEILGASYLLEGVKFYERGIWGGQGLERLKFAGLLTYHFLSYNKKLILLSCVCILPLFYYAIKRQKIFSVYRIANRKNEIDRVSAIATRKTKFVALLFNTYRQINLWIVDFPITIWIVFFIVAMGSVLLMALKGSIEPQIRYLAIANAFLTTVIALLAAHSIRILYTSNKRLAKRLAVGIIMMLVSLSLYSGFYHATGRTVDRNIGLSSIKDVVDFIRERKVPGDRVAFDFLNYKEYGMAAYLIDPSLKTPTQFVMEPTDPEIKWLLPKQLQEYNPQQAVATKTALIHVFIHSTHPRFLVLASNKFYQFMQKRARVNPKVGFSINPIRQYLSSVKGKEFEFIFQSPYIFPDTKILFTKIHENESFVILEQKAILKQEKENNEVRKLSLQRA